MESHLIKPPGDPHLLLGREIDVLTLRAVPQGRVEDKYLRCFHCPPLPEKKSVIGSHLITDFVDSDVLFYRDYPPIRPPYVGPIIMPPIAAIRKNFPFLPLQFIAPSLPAASWGAA
jgi:hypothetical protein